MIKKLSLWSVMLFCALQVFAQNKTFTLRLKWWNQFQFAGYYAAQLKGFYADEGLNIKIITGDAVHSGITEVLEGRADFSISGSDLLVEYANGKPFVALGAVFQHSPYVIVSLAQKNIKTPFDLVGKTIMASENQGWVELKAMLLEEGINIDSLKIKSHSWNNLDLVKGNADAMTAYRSVEVYQLQLMGVQPSFIEPVKYGIDFYGDVLFTRKDMVEKYPAETEKFRKASFKGWEYAMAHKKELIDYIMTLPGIKERHVQRAALEAEANAMNELMLPQIVEPGHMNEGRWKHILATHKKLGLIKKDIELKDFLYQIKPTAFEQLKNLSSRILIGIGSLFLIIVAYTLSVRNAVRKRTAELQSEIQERKTIQTTLKEKDAKLQRVMAESPDIICASNSEGIFTEVGGATLEVLGYSHDEMCGHSYVEFLHPDDIAKTVSLRNEITAGFRLFNFENRLLHKNGSVVYLSWSARWDDVEGVMYSSGRDVTVQKLTEQKYTTLVEHASDAIVIGDQTTKFIEANTAAFKLFGYTREEFLQLRLPDILVIEPGERPIQLSEILSGGTIRNIRKAKRKDGSIFIIELSSKMLPDGNILGVARDITEQKNNEERIRNSEQQLSLIFNKVVDIIFVLDVLAQNKFKFASANQSFFRTTGLTFDQVIGKYVSDVIPEPSLSAVLPKYAEAIRDKKTVQWEEQTTYPSGTKTGIVSVTPVFNNVGDCIQLIGSVHDITETKYVQSELIKMNERYEYVTNATFDAIWDWDLNTNEMYWGANFEKLFGYKPSQTRNINYSFENIHRDDKKRILIELNELIKGNNTNWEAEYRYKRADGTFAFVHDKAVVLRHTNGTAYRIIGAMRDITTHKSEQLRMLALEEEKEKRAQEREILINELSRNNKELKQFSYITSHNLRAPLTNLLAIADLIDVAKIEDENTKKLIEGFKRSTQNLNETLDDLIKILIIKESSNQILSEIKLSELYEQIRNSVQSIITRSNARIAVDFSACETVKYNRLYMESIFLNLITNSIKYAHPDRAPHIEIRSEKTDNQLLLIFKDNGIGFDMNMTKDRLFGLYQRFHDHADSRGIGLYLVHSQITSLGGTIEAESVPGEGTTFTITIKQ